MRGWAEERCEARKRYTDNETENEIGFENEHENGLDSDRKKSIENEAEDEIDNANDIDFDNEMSIEHGNGTVGMAMAGMGMIMRRAVENGNEYENESENEREGGKSQKDGDHFHEKNTENDN